MYLCTSGSNRDTISYFPIYMKHCTVSQANNDEGDTLFCTRCSCHYPNDVNKNQQTRINFTCIGVWIKIVSLSNFVSGGFVSGI